MRKMTLTRSKKAGVTREQVTDAMAAFLEKGGKINVLPSPPDETSRKVYSSGKFSNLEREADNVIFEVSED